MPMRIPEAGNPYGVGVAIGDTTKMGLVEMKENRFSTNRMVSGLGEQFSKTLAFWQNEVDETMIRDQANELQRFALDQKTNEKTGWANMKGKDALYSADGLSLDERTHNAFKAKYEELRAQCGSGRQRKKLDEIYQAMDLQRQQEIAGHVITQKNVWDADVDRRTLDLAFQQGIDYDNKVNWKSGFDAAKAVGERISKKAGVEYDPRVYVGPIHAQIIDNLVAQGRTAEAEKYYKEHKAEIGAKETASATKLLDVAKKKDQASAYAQSILSKFKSPAEQIAEAYKAPKNIRDQVLAEVRLDVGVQKTIKEMANSDKAQREKDLAKEKGNAILQAEKTAAAQLKAVEALPPEIRDEARRIVVTRQQAEMAVLKAEIDQYRDMALKEMDAEGKLSPGVEAFLKENDYAWYRQAMGKGITESDPAAIADLENMAANDPDKFAELDLKEYAGRLTKKDMTALINAQKKMGSESYKLLKRELNQRMMQDSKIAKDSEKQRAIRSAADALYDEMKTQRPGEYISPSDIRMICDSLLGEEDKWWSPKQGYEVVQKREKGVTALGALAGTAFEGGATQSDIEYVLSEKGVHGTANKDQIRAATQLARTGTYPADVWSVATKLANEFAKEQNAKGNPVRVTNKMIRQYADQALNWGNKNGS